MRIGIVGAGAIGSLLGAHLLRAGHDVALIDTSPSTIEAVNRSGLRVHAGHDQFHTPARAGRASEFAGEFDLIVIVTKGSNTAAALGSVSHLIGPATFGLTLQNGLGNAEVLADRLGAPQTIRGVIDYPADLLGPGVVRTSREGTIRIGNPQTPRRVLADVARAFTDGGLDAAVTEDVDAAIWRKLAFNCALNTVSASTGLTNGQIAASEHGRAVVERVVGEVAAVATASGINVSAPDVLAAVERAYRDHGDHRSSMLQDVESGSPTEIEQIGTRVLGLAERHGVHAPTLTTLCDLVLARSIATGGGYAPGE